MFLIGDNNEYGSEQEGFLRCQTPTFTARLKVEGCRVKNSGYKNKSEEFSAGWGTTNWVMSTILSLP